MPTKFTGSTRSDFPAGAIKTTADQRLFENQTRANEGAEQDAQWDVNTIISADGRTFEAKSREIGSSEVALVFQHPWQMSIEDETLFINPGYVNGESCENYELELINFEDAEVIEPFLEEGASSLGRLVVILDMPVPRPDDDDDNPTEGISTTPSLRLTTDVSGLSDQILIAELPDPFDPVDLDPIVHSVLLGYIWKYRISGNDFYRFQHEQFYNIARRNVFDGEQIGPEVSVTQVGPEYADPQLTHSYYYSV